MYSKLHRPKKDKENSQNNTGSCVKLVTYLDKETSPEKSFFSHFSDVVPASEVLDKIDNNHRTLKKKQDKFYMLSYNPSQREISHLVRVVTGKEIQELSELSQEEREKVFAHFREFVREAMNCYAQNFNREKEIRGEDLVYFGHIEEYRYYTYEDEEVKLGLKKRGDKKEGLQMHAHVIVSRMDRTQTVALSPLAKSTGNNNKLNGKTVKNGFFMKGWQADCFQLFSDKYKYIFTKEERYYYEKKGYEKVKLKMQQRIIYSLMEDMKEERKMMRNARDLLVLANPTKKGIQLLLKRKIQNILLSTESVI